MMLKKLILLIILILSIIFFSGKIKSEPLNENETINVEIRGCIRNPGIYKMNLGSDIADLLEIT